MAHLKHTTWHRQRGLTLVELMVTIAVIAILATTAVSTMSNMRAKQQVIAAAEEILSKAQRAKSLARKKSEDFQITFDNDANVGVLTVSGSDYTEDLNLAQLHPNVSVASNQESFTFKYLRSDVNLNGSITVTSKSKPDTYSANVVIFRNGRVRNCSVAGLNGRYDDC